MKSSQIPFHNVVAIGNGAAIEKSLAVFTANCQRCTGFSLSIFAVPGLRSGRLAGVSLYLWIGLMIGGLGAKAQTATAITPEPASVPSSRHGVIPAKQAKQLTAVEAKPAIMDLQPNSLTCCSGGVIMFNAAILNLPGRYRYSLTNGRTGSVGVSSGRRFSKPIVTHESGVQTYTLIISGVRGRASATASVLVLNYPQCSYLKSPNPTGCGSPTATIGQPLKLLKPTFDCTTKIIHLHVEGGNGNPIEFMAIGLTPWTTNCYHATELLEWDGPISMNINVRQLQANGSYETATFMWDYRDYFAALDSCNRQRGRQAIRNERPNQLHIQILGNPVLSSQVEVQILGVANQKVTMRVADASGKTIQEHHIAQAAETEQRTIQVGQQPGLYFLHISTSKEQKTVKLLRQ